MQNEEEIPKTMTPKQVPVTADNSIPAESDMYFAMFLKRSGVGKFYHHREPPIDAGGVRPNRDTLYSEAVFDLDAGLVTIMMPDAGERYMALQVISVRVDLAALCWLPVCSTKWRQAVLRFGAPRFRILRNRPSLSMLG